MPSTIPISIWIRPTAVPRFGSVTPVSQVASSLDTVALAGEAPDPPRGCNCEAIGWAAASRPAMEVAKPPRVAERAYFSRTPTLLGCRAVSVPTRALR
jgi:hypothetical protein